MVAAAKTERQDIDFALLNYLIVEDNAFMRTLLRGLVQAVGGRNIDTATNGREALDKMKLLVPDVVICDLEMAPISGLQLTKMIRERADEADCAIIMITGHAELKVVKRAKELGVTDFLAKPVSAGRMFDRLTAVGRKLEEARVERDNAWAI